MKKALMGIFLCLLLNNNSMAQMMPKGVAVVNNTNLNKIGKTWAVIVGVSRYKNVQSLNFADRDAQVFYDYLVKTDGGPKLDTSQVKLLLNTDATSANIFADLDWLRRSVQANDRVIFYFSGHGDVEKKTIDQNGFLLATDAPKAAYMVCGSIGLKYLQGYMDTYIVENKALDVILIADACRSGKLTGGSEGVQLTMRALGQPWNNQMIKILSAQEGELSYEDQKWGGGRGVFSYYLMKGIEGQAARSNDNVITTTDLKLYLGRAVADATGNTQNPNIDGNPRELLFTFNPKLLALAKQGQEPTGNLLASTGKGMADQLSPDVTLLYNQYLDYLKQGRLIWGKNEADTLNCARHVYWQLINKPGAENIQASLKSSFIGALQRKTQNELDDYVKGIKTKFTAPESFQEIFYLKQLIGPTFILYDYVMARAYFMQSMFSKNKSEKIVLLKKTLQIEKDAPYALNQLGSVYNELNKQDSALYWYQKALLAAPHWAFVL